jgi:agmatine/peptidylarginine deiminase
LKKINCGDGNMFRKSFYRSTFIMWILVVSLLSSSISPVLASKDSQDQIDNLESQVKPRSLTNGEEILMILNDPAKGKAQAYPWECSPNIYGFTDSPAESVDFPSEYASTTGVMIGWPSWGCVLPEISELIRQSVGRINVTVMVPPSIRQSAESCLKKRGITDEQLSQIEWIEMSLDSVWIRDYGSEIVNGKDGSRHLIDMSYYPVPSNTCNNLLGRPNDDAMPTSLSATWNYPVHRPQVRLEGGNLQTDGAGTCFRGRRVANARNNFSGWRYNETQLNEVLGRYYNCSVIALESMEGGVIDHIDMWMTIISNKAILVGKYDPSDDPTNAAILDRNAQRLSDMGYRVVRLPMPRLYCRQASMSAIGKENLIRPCSEPNTERIWATYTNSIRLGNVMAVPVYHWVPETLGSDIAQQETEALEIYQTELDREFGPNAVEVVPIVSDVMIPLQGAAHCVTMTYR